MGSDKSVIKIKIETTTARPMSLGGNNIFFFKETFEAEEKKTIQKIYPSISASIQLIDKKINISLTKMECRMKIPKIQKLKNKNSHD
jgi:hypothetical protein